MAKEATTIYIDDSAIWVLVASGRQPRKWANMPLEAGMVKDGVILNEDAVAAKVNELWQTEGIGAGRVIAGISGINCLYRLITLPELPKNLLPEAVRREAGRVLGVPLEGLYLSWQILPTLKGETLIYLVASPRNVVDALISTLRKARLNPYLMDLKPLAIARTATESRAIIIDVQSSSFDIVVMDEGIPQVIRSLALARKASWERKIAVIKEELDRSVTFYNSSHMDKPIEATVPLLVCGELAEHQNVWELLTGRQERPVQVLPSPVEIPEAFSSSQYMTNIGLALKELLVSEKGAITYSLVNFNALPEVYIPKPRSMSEVLFRPVIIGGIALIALGIFFNVTTVVQNTALRADLAAINQVASSRHVTAQDMMNLRGQVSSVEGARDAFSSTLNDFKDGRDEINDDLGTINSCLPGTVDLNKVSTSGDTSTVAGVGDDPDAVFSYARNLRAKHRFALVVITSMDDEGSFTLSLTK